jgi:hypothetical protein
VKLDEFTQPRWKNAAKYGRQRDKKYGRSKLSLPAVIQVETVDDATAPPLTSFGEFKEFLDNVPAISQRLQETSQPRSSHIRLGSVNRQSKSIIPSNELAAVPDSSMMLKVKAVEPVSFYPCI